MISVHTDLTHWPVAMMAADLVVGEITSLQSRCMSIASQLCGAAWLMVQLTKGQHTCELVFKPKSDILNICHDCQFVSFVVDELHVSHHA